MKMKKSKKYKNTKQIKKLYSYRKNYMNTYMHKVSKVVIEYAKTNKCGVIVIGDLKDIKQGMNYNKNFVQIPLHRLVQNIEYKAKLEGIKINADINGSLNILMKYIKKVIQTKIFKKPPDYKSS